jgi:hypothetical protein
MRSASGAVGADSSGNNEAENVVGGEVDASRDDEGALAALRQPEAGGVQDAVLGAVASGEQRFDEDARVGAAAVGHELVCALDHDDPCVDLAQGAHRVAVWLGPFRVGEAEALAGGGERLAQEAHRQDVAAQLLSVQRADVPRAWLSAARWR